MLTLTGTVLKIRETETKDYLRILNEDSVLEVTSAEKGTHAVGEEVEIKIEVNNFNGKTYFKELKGE